MSGTNTSSPGTDSSTAAPANDVASNATAMSISHANNATSLSAPNSSMVSNNIMAKNNVTTPKSTTNVNSVNTFTSLTADLSDANPYVNRNIDMPKPVLLNNTSIYGLFYDNDVIIINDTGSNQLQRSLDSSWLQPFIMAPPNKPALQHPIIFVSVDGTINTGRLNQFRVEFVQFATDNSYATIRLRTDSGLYVAAAFDYCSSSCNNPDKSTWSRPLHGDAVSGNQNGTMFNVFPDVKSGRFKLQVENGQYLGPGGNTVSPQTGELRDLAVIPFLFDPQYFMATRVDPANVRDSFTRPMLVFGTLAPFSHGDYVRIHTVNGVLEWRPQWSDSDGSLTDVVVWSTNPLSAYQYFKVLYIGDSTQGIVHFQTLTGKTLAISTTASGMRGRDWVLMIDDGTMMPLKWQLRMREGKWLLYGQSANDTTLPLLTLDSLFMGTGMLAVLSTNYQISALTFEVLDPTSVAPMLAILKANHG